MIDTILLDCDGVLANFTHGVAKLFNHPYEDLTQTWDLTGKLGVTNEEFWKVIDAAGADFWAELLEFEWASSLYATCLSRAKYVYIVTSPGKSLHAAAGKMAWLQAHFPSVVDDERYFICSHKNLLAKSNVLLIDDNSTNCEKFEKVGGNVLLFPQGWNNSKMSISDVLNYVFEKVGR